MRDFVDRSPTHPDIPSPTSHHPDVMSTLALLGIAIALAMDAFAVALAVGISLKTLHYRQVFRLSWHFGLFQAMMPVIGWTIGAGVRSSIQEYDHWLAFALLALVGGNMLREAFGDEEEESDRTKDATRGLTLVVLSVATSIDALAVGFSMSLLNISIVTPALVIGLVAAVFTIGGLFLGTRVAGFKQLSFYAEILGGLILWAIGLNILREHGVFGL
jgi:manganese efflux pump family protein